MTGRTKEELAGVTLLGSKQNRYPSDYAPEVLETFENKHPDNDYFVKFNCPEFTSLCPMTGATGFCHHLYLLCARSTHGGEQIAQAVSIQLP